MEYVRKGTVDWTGDNPPIYLKTDPRGDWSTIALFFRINASAHGRGNMTLVLQDPYAQEPGEACRLCVTDNAPLARYLIDGFVRKFGLFRPAAQALDDLQIIDGARFSAAADYPAHVSEIADFGGRRVEMRWSGLGEMFAVAQPPQDSQTGQHEMFSVFQPATSASVIVDGTALPGQTVERDFFDRRAQSAALAHSESWIQV
ncbi:MULTISPECIES: hypothetical protein [Leisingera]|uniref:hypothetical protein n=1 Tax=Leisingera TaxID=191028 RepID=UPI001C948883|nr:MULTISPECIES: hypothetical protein [Leisingera]MBY6058746.1 hypothetical protein [Leisingera daeponensis]